jgi:hypothetical protein
MSDFTQRQLHILNVDWNTAALWRMNEKGIAAGNYSRALV